MLFKMSASKMSFVKKKKKLERVLHAGTVGIPTAVTAVLKIHTNPYSIATSIGSRDR